MQALVKYPFSSIPWKSQKKWLATITNLRESVIVYLLAVVVHNLSAVMVHLSAVLVHLPKAVFTSSSRKFRERFAG